MRNPNRRNPLNSSIDNIQNPKNTCFQKGKIKKVNFRFSTVGQLPGRVYLNIVDSEVFVNYKVLDLQVLFPLLQESSQSDIGVKRYDQNTKTGQNISMSRFFPTLVQTNFSFFLCFHTSLTH